MMMMMMMMMIMIMIIIIIIVFVVCCDAVDGRWTDWTEWSACSKSCDSGIKSRSRDCTQPPPQHGGQVCQGDAVETISCSDRPCPGTSLTTQ